MPINLRPIAYGTGLTLSTDGALRIGPIRTSYPIALPLGGTLVRLAEQEIEEKHGDIERWYHALDHTSPWCLLKCGDWWYSVETTSGLVGGAYQKKHIAASPLLRADLNAHYHIPGPNGGKPFPPEEYR